MNQCSKQCDLFPSLVEPLPLFSLHDSHQLFGVVKHAHRVGKARVRGTGEDELGHSQLPYSAQSLKLRRIQDFPSEAIDLLIHIERHKPMDRVADAFRTQLSLIERKENKCNAE